ncbi:phage major capsid protein, P2 family [Acinetobacter sp. 1130196]|uniref:phage major capsid protein, P2 family n=1 Tax=Acinetobacter TaxID=469 RepID=UPI00044B06DF|nr:MULTISPECIES: phage major capsid protein, P2 family [Acinetobacter]EKU6035106.1 phage major capsid protein, P2 family [Acinetobacter nosocomialis]EXR18184.1 phage major capsid protein, P2 family [Acinetobacter sp. 1130196]MDH0190718.1 phage major capsid protein, P2 family [Acinetobacter ursingii]OTL04384.1 phage major capsid protein, P2 family [Acinetobacter nosocomialis]OTU50245.1 phage major capsid protein, P2 family [Acinetobacter nosocomialis]
MQLLTRQKYNKVMTQLAELNGVETVTQQFNVTPSVQQKLKEKLQESSKFLSLINVYIVREQSAEAIGMGISRPIASRTNTNNSDRQTKDPTGMDNRFYFCRKTDFDTAIKYQKLDQWAKFKNFYAMFRGLIIKRQALDRIMIGFNGTSIAADTDIVANPKLQDVNKGWLQKMREENPSRVMKSGATQNKITIGKTGDYKNIDALVMNIVDEMIDEVHQDNPDLVVMCNRKTVSDKYFPLVNQDQPNTEKLAADIIISQKRMGNLPVYSVPFFPEGIILVTTFDNLSIYMQEGGMRRVVIDNPKRDQIENYESSNEDYFIEDLGLACMAENIEIQAE